MHCSCCWPFPLFVHIVHIAQYQLDNVLQDGENIICPECAKKKMMEEIEAEWADTLKPSWRLFALTQSSILGSIQSIYECMWHEGNGQLSVYLFVLSLKDNENVFFTLMGEDHRNAEICVYNSIDTFLSKDDLPLLLPMMQ